MYGVLFLWAIIFLSGSCSHWRPHYTTTNTHTHTRAHTHTHTHRHYWFIWLLLHDLSQTQCNGMVVLEIFDELILFLIQTLYRYFFCSVNDRPTEQLICILGALLFHEEATYLRLFYYRIVRKSPKRTWAMHPWEEKDIGLFITLVSKVLLKRFLIYWVKNIGDFY